MAKIDNPIPPNPNNPAPNEHLPRTTSASPVAALAHTHPGGEAVSAFARQRNTDRREAVVITKADEPHAGLPKRRARKHRV